MELVGWLTYSRLRSVFYLLFVTIAVYLMSSLLAFYVNLKLVDSLPASVNEISLPQPKVHQMQTYQHYKSIWERNLFSVTTDETHKDRADDLMAEVDRLSLTSLNCSLIGTIVHENGDSWAIIKDNESNRQDRYTVGSTIRGAKIGMILRNKVVLNIDGKDELLIMGIEKIKAQTGDREESNRGDSEGEVLTYKVSKNFVQQSINNVAKIMSKVRIRPHFKNGKPAGFRISHTKKGSIFKTMGFQDGDIIKSVNGRYIHSAEDIMKLYRTLKDSHFFTIGVVRNNQPVTLNFKVR